MERKGKSDSLLAMADCATYCCSTRHQSKDTYTRLRLDNVTSVPESVGRTGTLHCQCIHGYGAPELLEMVRNLSIRPCLYKYNEQARDRVKGTEGPQRDVKPMTSDLETLGPHTDY